MNSRQRNIKNLHSNNQTISNYFEDFFTCHIYINIVRVFIPAEMDKYTFSSNLIKSSPSLTLLSMSNYIFIYSTFFQHLSSIIIPAALLKYNTINGLMLITSWWLVVSYSNQTIDTRIKGLVRETMQLCKAWYSSSIYVMWDLLGFILQINIKENHRHTLSILFIWMMFPSNVVYLENSILHIFPGCDVRHEKTIIKLFLAKISNKKKSKTCEKYQFEVSNCTTSYMNWNQYLLLSYNKKDQTGFRQT